MHIITVVALAIVLITVIGALVILTNNSLTTTSSTTSTRLSSSSSTTTSPASSTTINSTTSSSTSSSSTSSTSSTSSSSTTTTYSSTTTTTPQQGTIVYDVIETDNSITPNVFTANTNQLIWFNVTNDGTREHNFGIWYLGSSYGTPNLSPNGGKGVFEFSDSAPANFTVYSNLDNDEDLGLNGILTIR